MCIPILNDPATHQSREQSHQLHYRLEEEKYNKRGHGRGTNNSTGRKEVRNEYLYDMPPYYGAARGPCVNKMNSMNAMNRAEFQDLIYPDLNSTQQ